MDILVAILQVIMIPAGWGIVHHLSIKREHRTEWRNLSLSTISEIEEIEKLSINYHKSPQRNFELGFVGIEFLEI